MKMPETAAEAVEQLGALGRLISAKRWERAAIITMLVGPPQGAGPGRGKKRSDLNAFPYGVEELAAVGIHGLRSKATITHYRNQWCNVRPVPKPGDEVDLDGLGEWIGTTTAQKRQERAAAMPSIPATQVRIQGPESKNDVAQVMWDAQEKDPDLKAADARSAAASAAYLALVRPLYRAADLIATVDRVWNDHYENLGDLDRDAIAACLGDLAILIALRRPITDIGDM